MIKVCSTTGTNNTAGWGVGRLIFLLIAKSLHRSVLQIFEPRCFWMCKAHRKCEIWFVNTAQSRLVLGYSCDLRLTRFWHTGVTDRSRLGIPAAWLNVWLQIWKSPLRIWGGSLRIFIIPRLYCSNYVKSGTVSCKRTRLLLFPSIHHFCFVARQRSSDLSSSLSSFWDNTHLDTPHSVGLLWTSDQPDSKTSTWQHSTLTTDIHVPDKQASKRPQTHALARMATGIDWLSVLFKHAPHRSTQWPWSRKLI
jgi:hypothetical protein